MKSCLEGEGRTNNQKDFSRDIRPVTLARVHQLHVRIYIDHSIEGDLCRRQKLIIVLISSRSSHRRFDGYRLRTTLLLPFQSVVQLGSSTDWR